MIKIIRSVQELNFQQLWNVYSQSCRKEGKMNYPNSAPEQQLLLAEQDLYSDTKCFFQDPDALYALWETDGRYRSALRLEPYQDGLLLEGLETAPEDRNKGYAKALVREVLAQIQVPVYSHIDKKNTASLAVHLSCGFQIIRDCAVYADGSVSHRAYTMCK